MSAKPLLIVSCTDRKSLQTHEKTELRYLPEDLTVEQAAIHWSEEITRQNSSNTQKKILRELYQGEYWRIALNFSGEYETLVASAGLGMHSLDEEGVGYSATFSQGASDSVLRFRKESASHARKTWWKIINDEDGPGSSIWKVKCAPEFGRRPVFVVVSEGYQQALADDIVEIAEKWADVVVVSGSKPLKDLVEAPHIDHIRVGQNLRVLLNGSTSSVGIRFVSHFLESDLDRNAESAQKFLTTLNDKYQNLAVEEKLPKISRSRFADDQAVIDWILEAMEGPTVTNPSKSSLLRLLRDGGGACEQKRFGDLFDQALTQKKKTDKSVSKRR
jgi:hypothetical protein